MPELPEVETIARDIRPRLRGRTIVSATVFKPDILKRITRPRFQRALTGRRIVEVGRRAKNVIIELDDGSRLVIQPGMTGSLTVGRAASGSGGGALARRTTATRDGPKGRRAGRPAGRGSAGPEDPYDVIHLQLDSGRVARYRDVRRLGRVYLFTPAQWARHDAAIGPEPLDPAFTAGRLHALLRGSRTAVKKAIMDQRRLAGVGNIYANEALWVAGIDPSRAARKVTADEAERLHAAIVDILARSIDGRGTTFRDYRTGTGEPGSYQGRLAIYDRAGEPCLRCGRRIAMTHAIDARSSYFCPGCQR